MKRLLTALVAAGSILAATVVPAVAITKNYVVDNEHTFVGLIAFYDADGVFQHRCTGELLAPRVVLTAGHCTDNGIGASTPPPGSGSSRTPAPGSTAPTCSRTRSPGIRTSARPARSAACAPSRTSCTTTASNFAAFPNTHDIGLVILDQPITGLGFATLRRAGTLDSLDRAKGTQDTTFRVSGYGVSHSAKQG